MLTYLNFILLSALRRTAVLNKFILVCALFISALCYATTGHEVIGYGSGDDLAQALLVAQGDAVLNAGGKTAVFIESASDKLISDKGISSNALFVASYKIIEKGESFDGVYVRIKAKIDDVSNRKFDNGSIVEGEGFGTTARAARVAAIGKAIMNMGVRMGWWVKAVGVYEKDELLRDETEFTRWAYVKDIEELETSNDGEKFKVKVRAKVYESKAAAEVKQVVEKSSSGESATIIGAIAAARAKAVFDSNASYVARETYETGSFVSKLVRRNWKGFCYGTKIVNCRETANGRSVDVKLIFDDNEHSDAVNGLSDGVGYGMGNNREEAIECAKWDMVLNTGSKAIISTTYEDGKEPIERAQLMGSGYVGKVNVETLASNGGKVVCVTGQVSRGRDMDNSCMASSAQGTYIAEDKYSAYLFARIKALANAGAFYEVGRTYSANEIDTNKCKLVVDRADVGFDPRRLSGNDTSASASVKFKDVSGDGAVRRGVTGFAKAADEEIAKELAREDAAINARANAIIKARYDNVNLKESEQSYQSRVYLKGIRTSAEKLSNGSFLGEAKASAFENGSGDAGVQYSVSDERADRAMNIARRKALLNSGATINCSMAYKNTDLIAATALYTARGQFSNAQMNLIRWKKGFTATYVAEAQSSGKVRVIGYGFGDSFESARKLAIEDATLNAYASYEARENYEMGKLLSGESSFKANGFVFDIEILEYSKVGDKKFVKIMCTISHKRGSACEIAKKEVTVKGWGLSESAAKADAELNAIDAAFGREMQVELSEKDGDSQSRSSSSVAFANGYIDGKESKFERLVQENEVYVVTLRALVRQKGIVESSGWGFIKAIVMVFIFLVVIGGITSKSKVLGFIVGVLIAIGLFATGHWAVGVLIALGIIGMKKN